MKSILYVSVADAAIDRGAVQAIIAHSTRRNAADDITGVMLFNGTNFLQLIEGDDAVIDACFARIKRDPRHNGVVVMRDAAIAQREFPGWSMRFSFVDYPADDVLATVTAAGAPTADTLERIGAFVALGRRGRSGDGG